VIVMGMPTAGKSTLAESMVAGGYHRLNRDEVGGTLRGLLPALDHAVRSGATRIVLDVWLSTSIEDAQTNAAWRLVTRHGQLPVDAAFLPNAQFKYRRDFEPPDVTEGFSRVDEVPFVRRLDPEFVNTAVIVSCDDPADLAPLAARLREFRDGGYRLLGIAWRPAIAEGTDSEATVQASFADECRRLGLDVDVQICPHPAGPPRCWCRKPLPGLGVLFVHRYRLDPARCLYLGAGPHDAGFARRVGFTFGS
jgi:hypothetical protein